MTVSSNTDRATFPGNGATIVFPLPFRFFFNSEIQAGLLTNATGELTPLVLGTHYSLAGAGLPEVDGNAASVLTMLAAPSALQSLYVQRVMPISQPTDIVNQGKFLPEIHENVFDRLTMLIQQANGEGKGAIRVAIGDPEPTRLAPAAQRANLLMGFDSQGNPIAVAPVSGSAAELAMSLANDADPAKGAAQIGRGSQVVETISELRALLKTSPSKNALVAGYYSSGDGGGGNYYLDDSDVISADNGGSIIVANDGGRWKLIVKSCISIKQFGAKGDGITNDQPPIQAAVNFAISSGIKLVTAPSGEYLLNAGPTSDTLGNGVLIPFSQVNTDPADQLIFQGAGNSTEFLCGSSNMILFRMSRNCAQLRDVHLRGNSKTNVWGVGIVPESITQTAQLVSQSHCELHNVSRTGLTEGVVMQPGPHVGGSDSGCFYHEINGGISDTCTRHVWSKKNADWGTFPNRVTRTNFYNQKLLRGNTGYDFEVGTEINLIGCHEEMINSGSTPSATPTARKVSSDSLSIRYIGGYSEACTRSTSTPPPVGGFPVVYSFGYAFNSGADVNEWNNNADSVCDAAGVFFNFNPVLVSSGGGAQGAGTITGYARKLPGRMLFIQISGSIAPGTLAAGSLSLTGMPFAPSPASQRIPSSTWGGLTLLAGSTEISGLLAGGSMLLRRHGGPGGVDGPIQRSEISGATFDFAFQGIYSL